MDPYLNNQAINGIPCQLPGQDKGIQTLGLHLHGGRKLQGTILAVVVVAGCRRMIVALLHTNDNPCGLRTPIVHPPIVIIRHFHKGRYMEAFGKGILDRSVTLTLNVNLIRRIGMQDIGVHFIPRCIGNFGDHGVGGKGPWCSWINDIVKGNWIKAVSIITQMRHQINAVRLASGLEFAIGPFRHEATNALTQGWHCARQILVFLCRCRLHHRQTFSIFQMILGPQRHDSGQWPQVLVKQLIGFHIVQVQTEQEQGILKGVDLG